MPNHFQDGFKTLISFAARPNISFWERRVKPPSLEMGGKIEETTMYNSTYRVASPKSLISVGDLTAQGAYNEDLYTDFLFIGGLVTTVSITMPSTSVISYYGWLEKIDPMEHVEGESPNAGLTVCASMQSDANGGYTESTFDVAAA